MENAWPFIEQMGIIFQALEVVSDENENDAISNKFAGSNQKKVNGTACNVQSAMLRVQRAPMVTQYRQSMKQLLK